MMKEINENELEAVAGGRDIRKYTDKACDLFEPVRAAAIRQCRYCVYFTPAEDRTIAAGWCSQLPSPRR